MGQFDLKPFSLDPTNTFNTSIFGGRQPVQSTQAGYIQGLQIPQLNSPGVTSSRFPGLSFGGGNAPIDSSAFGVNPGASYDTFGNSIDIGMGNSIPDVKPTPGGGWFDMQGKGGLALGAAQVGLGAFNAYEQSKANKFMRDYYGTQMDLQKVDFESNARSTNKALHDREDRRLSAQGISREDRQPMIEASMDKWGVSETF